MTANIITFAGSLISSSRSIIKRILKRKMAQCLVYSIQNRFFLFRESSFKFIDSTYSTLHAHMYTGEEIRNMMS